MSMTKEEIFESDYDDLVILKDWINKAIQKKEEEKRVKLWELSDMDYIIGYFSSRESALECAEQIIKDERNEDDSNFKIHICAKYVRESEVDYHLEM